MTRLSHLPAGYMLCEDCQKPTRQANAMQRYCPGCSRRRDAARTKVDTRASRRSGAREQSLKEAGRRISEAESMVWPADEHPELLWVVRIAMPFTYAASKNHIWATNANGYVYNRSESTSFREDLTERIRRARPPVVRAKLYLDVMVEKPNHEGDAVNVVDLVCDAVKDAIDLDDRWYSIRRLDWVISKRAPRLMVGLGQADEEDHQICSYCGRILPYAYFRPSRSQTGVGRTCADCNDLAALIRKGEA
jgi:hypothetical protein